MSNKNKSNTNSLSEAQEVRTGLEELDESLHYIAKGESNDASTQDKDDGAVDDIYGVDLEEELEGEEEEEEEEESEDEEDEESGDNDETDDEEESEDEDNESSDTVPLKTFVNEKRKNKNLLRRLEALEARVASNETSNFKSKLLKKYEEAGHDTDLVGSLIDDFSKLIDERQPGRNESNTILDEIEDLASDDMFSDIENYADEIVDRIAKFKKAGEKLSVEDAYFSVLGKAKVKAKIKGQSVKDKAVNRIKAKKNSVKKLSASKDVKFKNQNNYGLSKKDINNFNRLKKMQPGAGWTLKKYAQYITKPEVE